MSVGEYYGTLRAPPYRWTWDQIAESTDEEILVTVLALFRQHNRDGKDTGGTTKSVLEQRAEYTDEQRKAEFEMIARRQLRIPDTPEGKKYLEAMWQQGLKRREARLAAEAAEQAERDKPKQ